MTCPLDLIESNYYKNKMIPLELEPYLDVSLLSIYEALVHSDVLTMNIQLWKVKIP